jgi:hypothetical protein
MDRHSITCNANNNKTRELKESVKEYESHINILEYQLKDTKNQLKELQDRYDKLAMRPTTTQNNRVTNNVNIAVFDKTDQDIKDIVDEKYTKHYMLQGQKGVARFTADEILLRKEDQDPIYMVVDKSRGNGKYMLGDKMVNDLGMKKLTKKVYPYVKKKACIICRDSVHPLSDAQYTAFQDVVSMEYDNEIFRKEMAMLI